MADAIDREKPAYRLDAGLVLSVSLVASEPAPAGGLGEEYRLGTPELAGATLVAQRRVADLVAFRSAEPLSDAPGADQQGHTWARPENRLRVIISHVPRGNQLARQWQRLQMIDRPGRIAVDDAAREPAPPALSSEGRELPPHRAIAIK